MIIKEPYNLTDGIKRFRYYSDISHYIRQNETGVEYAEAIDLANAPYTYTETDKVIPEEEEDYNG